MSLAGAGADGLSLGSSCGVGGPSWGRRERSCPRWFFAVCGSQSPPARFQLCVWKAQGPGLVWVWSWPLWLEQELGLVWV